MYEKNRWSSVPGCVPVSCGLIPKIIKISTFTKCAEFMDIFWKNIKKKKNVLTFYISRFFVPTTLKECFLKIQTSIRNHKSIGRSLNIIKNFKNLNISSLSEFKSLKIIN